MKNWFKASIYTTIIILAIITALILKQQEVQKWYLINLYDGDKVVRQFEVDSFEIDEGVIYFKIDEREVIVSRPFTVEQIPVLLEGEK